MRWVILALVPNLLFGCALSNTASRPTGAPSLSTNGAGIYIGASAGASVGGGPLGAGTDDNRAGAR